MLNRIFNQDEECMPQEKDDRISQKNKAPVVGTNLGAGYEITMKSTETTVNRLRSWNIGEIK